MKLETITLFLSKPLLWKEIYIGRFSSLVTIDFLIPFFKLFYIFFCSILFHTINYSCVRSTFFCACLFGCCLSIYLLFNHPKWCMWIFNCKGHSHMLLFKFLHPPYTGLAGVFLAQQWKMELKIWTPEVLKKWMTKGYGSFCLLYGF